MNFLAAAKVAKDVTLAINTVLRTLFIMILFLIINILFGIVNTKLLRICIKEMLMQLDLTEFSAYDNQYQPNFYLEKTAIVLCIVEINSRWAFARVVMTKEKSEILKALDLFKSLWGKPIKVFESDQGFEARAGLGVRGGSFASWEGVAFDV